MSGKRQPQQVPDYTGLSLQTSSMSLAVPYMDGLSRGSPNLIYYSDYEVHKHTSKGGKGGATGKQTSYTYSATIILALCEGPIGTVTKTWVDNGYISGFTAKHFELFNGSVPQAPWSYLVSNHPEDAFGYQGIAHMDAANYDLGSTPTVPQHSFEWQGPSYGSGWTGAGDADCAGQVQRFLTDPECGALFPSAYLDATALLSSGAATTTGDSAYQTYCRAMGWGISPHLQNQEPALDVLARWAQITNTAPVWTGYSLKFVPWGDSTVTGNGVTYLPPTTSVFSFGDNEYLQDKDRDPVEGSLSDWFDASNAVAISVRDRDQNYDNVPIDWIDQTQNELIGRRYASTIQANEICYLPMAYQVVSLIGQRMVYVRETYVYKVGPEWSELEPVDYGEINESALGLNGFPVCIRDIVEQDDGGFEITVEEFPGTLGQPSGATTQGGIRAYTNTEVAPDPINTPIIFEPNSQACAFLNGGSTQALLCILASGGSGGVNDPNWGGGVVNVSTDGGSTYGPIGGNIPQSGIQGTMTAGYAAGTAGAVDSAHTLSVNLAESAGALTSASSVGDAEVGVTLGIIQDGVCSTSFELVGPETATLTGSNTYNLTNVVRGMLGTASTSHSSGALYGRLDNSLWIFPMPPNYIGQALKIKIQSFNTSDKQLQDISTCTVYTYTPAGTGYGGGTGGVPTTPTGLSASATGPAQIGLTWTANLSTDNVDHYLIFRAPGTGASFGSASQIDTSATASYTDTGLPTGTGYTYFVEAVNTVGPSSHSTGANGTTNSSGFGGPWGASFSAQDISSKPTSTVIGRAPIPFAWTLPATTSTPAGYVTGKVDTGPSAQTDFDLLKDGVSVGTLRFASSATTPTLIKASDTAFVDGDYLDLKTPSDFHGMSGAFGVAVIGVR